jgi:hypothetical protein
LPIPVLAPDQKGNDVQGDEDRQEQRRGLYGRNDHGQDRDAHQRQGLAHAPLGQANEHDGRNGNEIEVDVGKHWRRLILLSSPSIGFPQ